MKKEKFVSVRTNLVENINHIYSSALASRDGHRCMVAPHPDLKAKIVAELATLKDREGSVLRNAVRAPEPRAFGLNDGVIIPPDSFPLGTPMSVVRSAAADRAPLRGVVRVVVILVDFSDRAMAMPAGHYQDLFFSQGVIPTKSVREYFSEVTNGLVDIQGEVAGPFRLPSALATYAHGAAGTGATLPNARTMARDAVIAANPTVSFSGYDNDGNGFVDAFIVVHAGPGGEVTGNPGDIWSHKWVLDGGASAVDGTHIFGYLTVPEDARIGVCCHELGHLLFGYPDLYDTDGTSEGIGDFCLMSGGSWGGGGHTPVHPSAWCKANQGWISVDNRTSNGPVTITDVKTSHTVLRLWKDGGAGSEYFLVENRQRTAFDASLPGEGLLIWHIDDSIPDNTNEVHPKVALIQADGLKQLDKGINRGDASDPYPGSTNNIVFNNVSTPNSKSYAGQSTCVSISGIPASGINMSVNVAVRCKVKEKEIRKDMKDARKEFKEKERKEAFKERLNDGKTLLSDKPLEKPVIDKQVALDKGFADTKLHDGKFSDQGKLGEGGGVFGSTNASLLARLEALEAAMAALAGQQVGTPNIPESYGAALQPFIGSELRPDLSQGALLAEEDYAQLNRQMQQGSADAKRCFDTKQKEIQ